MSANKIAIAQPEVIAATEPVQGTLIEDGNVPAEDYLPSPKVFYSNHYNSIPAFWEVQGTDGDRIHSKNVYTGLEFIGTRRELSDYLNFSKFEGA